MTETSDHEGELPAAIMFGLVVSVICYLPLVVLTWIVGFTSWTGAFYLDFLVFFYFVYQQYKEFRIKEKPRQTPHISLRLSRYEKFRNAAPWLILAAAVLYRESSNNPLVAALGGFYYMGLLIIVALFITGIYYYVKHQEFELSRPPKPKEPPTTSFVTHHATYELLSLRKSSSHPAGELVPLTIDLYIQWPEREDHGHLSSQLDAFTKSSVAKLVYDLQTTPSPDQLEFLLKPYIDKEAQFLQLSFCRAQIVRVRAPVTVTQERTVPFEPVRSVIGWEE
jgi:hypothetical protein